MSKGERKAAHLVQKAKELMKHVPLSKHVHHACVGPVPMFNDLHKVRQVMFQRWRPDVTVTGEQVNGEKDSVNAIVVLNNSLTLTIQHGHLLQMR
jgi:hypothetical protein